MGRIVRPRSVKFVQCDLEDPADTTVRSATVDIDVIIVGSPSMSVTNHKITLLDEWYPSIHEFCGKIDSLCKEQSHRTYWRVAEADYLQIYCYIGLKAALNFMPRKRRAVYVVVDDAPVMFYQQSCQATSAIGKAENFVCSYCDIDGELCDSSCLVKDPSNYLRSSIFFTDLDVLRCTMPGYTADPDIPFDDLLTKTPPLFTRELEHVDRQLSVLIEGFPETKENPLIEPFPEVKNIAK